MVKDNLNTHKLGRPPASVADLGGVARPSAGQGSVGPSWLGTPSRARRPLAGHSSLDAGEEEAAHVQQESLFFPHRPATVEDDRDIVVVAQLRWPGHLL